MWEMFIVVLLALGFTRYARLWLIRRKDFDSVSIIPGAEPIAYDRSRVGVMFIHGFTGTPWDYKFLGKYLADRNITVRAPLLAGHGTTPEHLATIDDQAWNRQLKGELRKLRKRCDVVFVGGDSFGGNLAINLAAESKVDGVIVLGTPIYFRRGNVYKVLFFVMRWFKLFKKKWYHRSLSNDVKSRRVTYDRIPLATVSYVNKVIGQSKRNVKRISCPFLIMQSTTDHGVDSRSVDYMYRHAKSPDKRVIWVNDKYHVFIIDRGKEAVFRKIHAFIKEHARPRITSVGRVAAWSVPLLSLYIMPHSL